MTDLTSEPVPIDPYDPVDLLSFIPYEFGYRPHDSLVTVTIRGTPLNPTFGLFGRFDVTPGESPGAGNARRRLFLDNLHRQGTLAGYIVVYSDPFLKEVAKEGPVGEPEESQVQAIFKELAHLYDYPPFAPHRTLVVGHSTWRCFTCPSARHCPEDGHPIEDLDHTRISLEMILQGRTYAPSRESLISIPTYTPPPGPAGGVTETLGRLEAGPRALRNDRWMGRMGDLWGRAVDGVLSDQGRGTLPEEDLCILGLSLASIGVRDNVIYSLCTQRPLPDVRSRSERHFAQMFTNEEQPEHTRAAASIALLREVVRYCPPEHRAPALTVWGWCHWWNGDGTEANILVETALRIDHRYSLARTLRTVLNGNLLPPWLKARFASET